ncbi:HEAT repeat domain-containing protein [Amycolatopsis sp. NPDC059090]|uniref:HEAT repeat domain-containing protein n=1 Tax=unclassified Amycolatopsis TaxID=2618356 RepID=UPI00366DFB14
MQDKLDVYGYFKDILKSPDSRAASMSVALVKAEGAGVDEAIFKSLRREIRSGKVLTLALRVLVERDRDRDSDPLLDLVPDGHVTAVENPSSSAARSAIWAPIVTRYQFGFSRLRKLGPVGQYDKILRNYPTAVRMKATIGLGDSGEVYALHPLANALKDKSPNVRTFGADAVRRLGNGGLREEARQHPVRQLLVELLQDDQLRETRIAAARALGSFGEFETLREHSPKSSRDQREWARILQGEIPPLKRTWPGDLTI